MDTFCIKKLHKTLKLTGKRGEPFTTTPSAKRTRDGLDLSLAFLAALRRADFLAD